MIHNGQFTYVAKEVYCSRIIALVIEAIKKRLQRMKKHRIFQYLLKAALER